MRSLTYLPRWWVSTYVAVQDRSDDQAAGSPVLLSELLGQRLSEKLDAFDQAYASVTPENSIAEFIERYIATVTGGPSAVKLDNALFASINDNSGLAKLMNRYQSDTVDRYVKALETAGSTWSRHDLRGAANYLASIASHFEQNLEKHRHERRTQLMQKMVQDTFITIARSTLKPLSVVPSCVYGLSDNPL